MDWRVGQRGPSGSLEADGVGVAGVVAVEREKSRLLPRCLLVADRASQVREGLCG